MPGLYSQIMREDAAGFWLRRLAGLCLTLALSPSVFPKDQIQSDTQIRLIRGLMREVAVSKVPLPRGKKGVRVDSQGKLDKAIAAFQKCLSVDPAHKKANLALRMATTRPAGSRAM